MKTIGSSISLLFASGIVSFMFAAVNVPLTIQEALYKGGSLGVARNADPVSIGVPLPDDPDTGITDVNQLSLSGATVGQFRVLGRWPSGRIKWVQVDTQADVTAGQIKTGIILTSGATGNFGGASLASDNGTTITISTAAATFTIRKANFNVVDQVVIAGKTVVTSGSSQGLVLTGPTPGQTSCSPCATMYSSANDPNSTAVIEENGPAKAVIRATGTHVDSAGHAYLHFTVRMYFYAGKSFVKVTSILRNADHGASNTEATAYKGLQGYELQISPQLSGTANYSIANHTASATVGSLGSSDAVYLYQGQSQQMKWQDWCGSGCVPYTTDVGYRISKNGTTVISGSDTQYPQGWADVGDSAGTGVEIGVYQLSAYWPKSLEFNAGGRDVRIGIWARENSIPVYQPWPQWTVNDLYLNFHAAAPASPVNDFLRFQHYLLGRAPLTHYNATGVFPYPILDPATEDAFYTSTASSAVPALSVSKACCIQDFGTSDANWPLSIYRFYSWGSPGGANQTEFRWSYLLNFLSRGMTGRYLNAAHFYKYQAESIFPHADGFAWRNYPAEVDGFGFPKAASANSALGFRNWKDQEHGHWYGMTDYYFLSGDETIHDTLLDGPKNWFMTENTYQNAKAGGLYNSRSIGVQLIGSARFSQFLATTGDPDAAAVLNQGTNTYLTQVKPDLCVAGYPAGCVLGAADGGPWKTQGVSRVRGVPWGAAGTSGSWCGVSHAYRVNSSFQPSILIQGLLEFRNVAGSSWNEYQNALDLAYGIAQWNLSENYVDDGSGRWDINGFRFGLALDVPNRCNGTGEKAEDDFQPTPTQTTSMTFLARYMVEGATNWATRFKINLQKDMAALGTTTSDFGSYQIASVIAILSNPSSSALSTVPISGFADNGGGSYTISWTVPTGARSYRIKWGSKRIVDWIGFDPANNVFTGDPANTMAWFAANNVSTIPAPAAGGQSQSLTIATGTAGLTAANFSVKAYVTGAASTQIPSVLSLISGNGQSGPPGQPLSSPFTVKVTDSAGAAVSGIAVVFTVTAGGGTLSTASVATDAQGLASTSLTLGPTAGANTVTATAGSFTSSSITFSAIGTAAAATATNLALSSGNAQSGSVSTPLTNPFVVKATSATGAAVAGVAVTFSVTSGGGSLTASNVTTDSSGLASTTLVLGTSAGPNTVSATAAGLVGNPITFTATATGSAPPPSGGTADVAWKQMTPTTGWPGYNGYLTIWFDPASKKTILYGVTTTSSSIYSTDLFFYDTITNTFTHHSGTGSLSNVCPADTPSQPGNRHPGWQMAIDTKRNFMWLWGGVCQGVNRTDMYYLKLTADPMLATWHQLTPAHTPLANNSSATAYDPDDDVLFVFGSDSAGQTNDNWVYCRTAENPTPGVLTAKQSAAGCAVGDDWNKVTLLNSAQPSGPNFPGLIYDTVTKKVIQFGGMTGALVARNETWAYDVPTHLWTRKALNTVAPPVYTGPSTAQPALVYNSHTNKVLYHQTSNTGAPADWQYDPVADTWTKLTSSNGGPIYDLNMAYDFATETLIGWSRNPANGRPDIWQGVLSTTVNPCDLNLDHTVNVQDVQLAIRQALGASACTTADLNGDKICNSVDVQRIIAASLGGACQTGR